MNSVCWLMMLMVLVRWVKQVPVLVKNRVARMRSIFISPRLQNQWHLSVLLLQGPRDIIDYIRYNIRSQIFAKSLPMPLVVGNLKRLELLRTHPELKEKLWSNARKLQNGLKEKGFDIGKTDSPVTPVYMKGGVEEATAMVMDLRENYGIFASIVVYPVIPKGHIIYRLIPTAAHTDADIEATLKAFEETKKKLDAGAYKVDSIPDMAEYSGKRFEYMLDKPKNK